MLAHSIECAQLASMIADELGAGNKTARRAALLHDIGKAVTHEIEGPHALVGGDLARKYGETEAVAHAMEAHHNEVEPQTVEAVIVQIADALSGARPGARGESLESYTKRLRELEQIAQRHTGVEKVYAMQAGREIRVIVRPGGRRRRLGGAAVAPDRARRREGARVRRADQGDGDPGVARGRLREVGRSRARLPSGTARAPTQDQIASTTKPMRSPRARAAIARSSRPGASRCGSAAARRRPEHDRRRPGRTAAPTTSDAIA